MPNLEVLLKAGSAGIAAHLICTQLRWTGDVIHMPETHPAKQILYSKLSSGNSKHAGQMAHFKRYSETKSAQDKYF